jgi:hypothetical protein
VINFGEFGAGLSGGKTMNILIAMAAGLVGGTLTGVAGFFVTVWVCQALGVSGREGGIGYAGMFLGFFVGVAGMIGSMVLALRLRHESTSAIAAHTPMAVAGIVALAALGVFAYYRSHDHPVVDGAPPILDFELQAPPNSDLPDAKTVQIKLRAGESRADGWWDETPPAQVEGRPALTGHLQLYLRTSQRLMVLEFAGEKRHLFQLRLPASPLGRKYRKWSDWQSADCVFTPESNVGQRVAAENAYRVRYLVESIER